MAPTIEVWLKVAGVCERAQVSKDTVLRELRAGRLRGVKVGGRRCWRSRPEWVDAWLEHRETPEEIVSRVRR